MIDNPYAKYLEGRDPLDVMQETPRRLSELAQQLGQAGLEKPWAEGKWSGRFIVCHLADCEVAFGFRWRQVVASPGMTIQTFDQDSWAKWYATLDSKWALGAFTSARRWNLEFLKTVPADAMEYPVTHPERGKVTLRGLLQINAGHDVNHLRQLEALAGGG